MKQIIVILSTAIFLLGCGKAEQQQSETFIKNVNAIEFKELVESGNGIILDVRTPGEVSEGYINNASVINYHDNDFVEKVNLISKDQEIYVYCKSGGRSSAAAEVLQKNGFTKIYNLGNGIIEWEGEGFPLARTKIAKDEKIEEISLTDFEILLKTDKPVLIDFHTVWCSPCRKMAPVIDKIEEEYKNKAIIKRIDIDKSKEVGKAFNIRGVPVFILFKNGEDKWKHNGVISEEEIKEQIEKYL